MPKGVTLGGNIFPVTLRDREGPSVTPSPVANNKHGKELRRNRCRPRELSNPAFRHDACDRRRRADVRGEAIDAGPLGAVLRPFDPHQAGRHEGGPVHQYRLRPLPDRTGTRARHAVELSEMTTEAEE